MARCRFCSFYVAGDELWKTLDFSPQIGHAGPMGKADLKE